MFVGGKIHTIREDGVMSLVFLMAAPWLISLPSDELPPFFRGSLALVVSRIVYESSMSFNILFQIEFGLK